MVSELSFACKMALMGNQYQIPLEETRLQSFLVLLAAWLVLWVILFKLNNINVNINRGRC